MGWDIVTVVRFAFAMAEMKCRRIGGRAGITDLHGVMLFLKRGVSNCLWVGPDLRSGSVVD